MKRRNTLRHRVSWLPRALSLPVAVLIPVGGAASAQAPEEQQLGEEIIVTATKRSEAITNVPFSVSAVSGEDLKRQQAHSLSSFLSQIPGVAPVDFQGEGTNVIIRGLSTAVDGEGNGTTSSVYFGETMVGGNLRGGQGSPNFRPVDIDRVEVLRGPQGSLFGAGALAGVVRIVPHAPDLSHMRAGGSASLWDKADGGGLGTSVDGYINMPIVADKAALRVVGYYEDDSGFVYNTRLDERLANSKIVGGRAALGLKPASNVSLTATLAYQRRKADGSPDYNPLLPRYRADRYREAQDRKALLGDLIAKVDFGDIELTSVSSLFQDRFKRLGIEYDHSQLGYPKVRRLSQEVRLASPDDRNIRWLVGGYAESLKTTGGYAFVNSATEQLQTLPFGYVGYINNLEQTQYALFGELAVDFADAFTFTAGGRLADYSQHDRSIRLSTDTSVPGRVPLDELPPADGPFNTRYDTKLKDHAFTPRLNLSYKPNTDQTYYVQAARGFRVGGIAPVVSDSCALAGAGGPFKSDSIWSYEAGAKVAALDRRVMFTGAAYYSTWKDIPVFLGDLSCFQFYTANAAKARNYGLETEVTARVTRELHVGASLSYNNAKLTDLTGAAGAGRVGEPLVGAPKWVSNISFDYERPVSSRVAAFASGNANYVGKYSNGLSCDFNGFAALVPPTGDIKPIPGLNGCYNSYMFNPPQFIPDPKSGDYVTANLQLGVRLEKFKVYGFARNIFNDKSRTYINYLGQDGFLNYNRVPPRVVGVAVQADY